MVMAAEALSLKNPNQSEDLLPIPCPLQPPPTRSRSPVHRVLYGKEATVSTRPVQVQPSLPWILRKENALLIIRKVPVRTRVPSVRLQAPLLSTLHADDAQLIITQETTPTLSTLSLQVQRHRHQHHQTDLRKTPETTRVEIAKGNAHATRTRTRTKTASRSRLVIESFRINERYLVTSPTTRPTPRLTRRAVNEPPNPLTRHRRAHGKKTQTIRKLLQ